MQGPWISTIVMLAVAFVFAFGVLFAWAVLRVRPKVPPPPSRYLTYECGEEPQGEAWIRFHPRYYLVAMIFILFDVETVFLLPWALTIEKLGLVSILGMFSFLGILFLGWIYALKKGALKWQ